MSKVCLLNTGSLTIISLFINSKILLTRTLQLCYNLAMFEQKLQQLGLSEKEASIYLCILENTKITPASIARKTKISRPTVYSVVKELVKKGFITEDITSTGLYLVALSVNNILKDLEKKKVEIEDQFKIAQSLISDLGNMPKSQKYSIPKLRFIDDIHLEDFSYTEAPVIDKSALERDATWWGFQDSAFTKNYSKWLEWYWKRADPRMRSRMITNAEDIRHLEKGNDPRIQNKIWNKGEKIRVTQAVIGDYVLIANTNQKPYYLVEIHDAVIAESLRQVFKGIWEGL